MNTNLTFTGGCYCGDVRYQCEGPPLLRGLCYCRTCQAISGGAGNLYMAVEAKSFQLIKVGTLDDPVVFEGPQMVTWTSEMQKFHLLPSDVPAHPEFPRPKGPDRS